MAFQSDYQANEHLQSGQKHEEIATKPLVDTAGNNMTVSQMLTYIKFCINVTVELLKKSSYLCMLGKYSCIGHTCDNYISFIY